MKKLLFILFLVPFLSLGQGQSQPFKGANTIIIQTNDSSHVAFKKLAQLYVDSGLSVGNANKELGVLNSNPKSLKNTTCNINASIANGSNCRIVLSGNFQYAYSALFVGGIPTMPIIYKGMKGSPYMDTWTQMQKVAESYPNATFTFEKR